MKNEKRLLKLSGLLSLLLITALTLAACGSPALAAQLNDGKLTICHANGNAVTPYDALTLDFNGLVAHAGHTNDIIPAPAEGCPKTVEAGYNLGKLTICHATDSATNPYNKITIDFNGLIGHSTHAGDIIPAPETGCPSVTPTAEIIATATTTMTPSGTATATATMTPYGTAALTTTPQASNNDKVTICHATGSSKNRYVEITVSVNGLNGHGKHPGDIIPAPAGGCPN